MTKEIQDNIEGLDRTYSDVGEAQTIIYETFFQNKILNKEVKFIITKGPISFCAYVGIPLSHPLSWLKYPDINSNMSHPPHGLFTYSSHKKIDGWPEGLYWYGWDYSQKGDKRKDEPINRKDKDNVPKKDWTINEIIKDSKEALYSFLRLMTLSEKIANKYLPDNNEYFHIDRVGRQIE